MSFPDCGDRSSAAFIKSADLTIAPIASTFLGQKEEKSKIDFNAAILRFTALSRYEKSFESLFETSGFILRTLSR